MSDEPTRNIHETYTTTTGEKLEIHRVVYHDDDGGQNWVEQQLINGKEIYHITRHADGNVNVHDHDEGTYLKRGYRIDHEGYDNSSSSSSGGGGCYIATATIQGHFSVDVLNPLKSWRYQVLEKSKWGMSLSSYYRQTAPSIAPYVVKRERLSAILRNLLIKPAISLVDKRADSQFKFGYDVVLHTLFLIGLSIAEILKRIENLK